MHDTQSQQAIFNFCINIFIYNCKLHTNEVKSLSRVRLLATPWTTAYQAPPSIGFATNKEQCVLPGWLSGKESAYNAGVAGMAGSIPGSERSPGRGHGNPLQYSCLENPIDRGAWWATIHRV